MDTSAVLKVFRYNLKHLKYKIPILVCSFLFGILVVFVIVKFIDNENYANLGTFLSCFLYWIVAVVFITISFVNDYKHIVKMGMSRKNYIIGTVSYNFVSLMAFGGITLLLARLEVFITSRLFRNIPVHEMLEKTLIENPYFPFIVGLGVLVLGIYCSAVILKFGLKGFAVLYFGFLFATMSIPKRSHRNIIANIPNSAVSSVLNVALLLKIAVIAVIAFIVLALLVLSIRIMMKTEIA